MDAVGEGQRTSGCVIYTPFVDLRKAYDSVSRDVLCSVLEKCGVPPRMLNTKC